VTAATADGGPTIPSGRLCGLGSWLAATFEPTKTKASASMPARTNKILRLPGEKTAAQAGCRAPPARTPVAWLP
jgi:hypothetical protein